MYKRFYNLQRNPFEITPDPSFLFATRHHNEALASLYYGVKRRKGFVVLTGEVGTGKTLLVRCLLQILSRANIAYAYVFNPRLTPMEFLQYIAGDFGLSTSGKSKSELLLEISAYVIARYKKSCSATVLVVDEAHHLSADVLEEVRLLTNLETADQKLLQILLIGQPELDEKLDSVALRQLKQRIALRSQLTALTLEQTEGYVYRRLKLAGSSNPAALFPKETILELYRQSRGYPRLINTVCENALIHGYAWQESVITPDIIEEIATDFRLNIQHPSPALQSGSSEQAPEVRQAAMTLLDLYKRLQTSQNKETEQPADSIGRAVMSSNLKIVDAAQGANAGPAHEDSKSGLVAGTAAVFQSVPPGEKQGSQDAPFLQPLPRKHPQGDLRHESAPSHQGLRILVDN
jgi:general secretion pathway protein A